LKKLVYSIVLILIMFLSITNLNAQRGGFTGPGLELVSVQEAKTFRDDTPVLIQGKILRSLGNEKYLFGDETDTIIVEIDDDLWKGLYVSEEDLVEIYGEIEKSIRKTEIEVDRIRKL